MDDLTEFVMEMADDLISVTEAANLLGTTRANIYERIDRKRLVPIKLGAVILISRRELEAYRKSMKRSGRSTKR